MKSFTNHKTKIALKLSQFHQFMYFTGYLYSIYGQPFSQLGGIFQRLPHFVFIMSTGQRISHLFFITIIASLWIGYTSTSTNSEYYTLIYCVFLLFLQVFCCYSYSYFAVILTVFCYYSYIYFAVILTVIMLLFLKLLCCYSYIYCAVILTAIVLLLLQYFAIILTYIVLLLLQVFLLFLQYFAIILTYILLLFLQLLCCYS